MVTHLEGNVKIDFKIPSFCVGVARKLRDFNIENLWVFVGKSKIEIV